MTAKTCRARVYATAEFSSAAAARGATHSEQLAQQSNEAHGVRPEMAMASDACAGMQVRHFDQGKRAHGYLRWNVQGLKR
jgi:hypothetical protein